MYRNDGFRLFEKTKISTIDQADMLYVVVVESNWSFEIHDLSGIIVNTIILFGAECCFL